MREPVSARLARIGRIFSDHAGDSLPATPRGQRNEPRASQFEVYLSAMLAGGLGGR
ncbi:hypothetical protein [Pannonibacter sp. SL95]|uniref:hypothetical protein n=1 Tax=Pannonibacter sp. SL95 TaxID=2995153 RepID=UPI002275A202|nr:hypothetical protein [Pannonibacter sp. SL95]MCY1706825.1 hypothetical protein [Pannonibacter sp. SL95]